MGAVYGKLRQYTEGIAACKKAIAIKPDYADAYYNRAAAYYYSCDYDKAWADVPDAEETWPQTPQKEKEETQNPKNLIVVYCVMSPEPESGT